jgi:hypothetical protein
VQLQEARSPSLNADDIRVWTLIVRAADATDKYTSQLIRELSRLQAESESARGLGIFIPDNYDLHEALGDDLSEQQAELIRQQTHRHDQ